MLQVIDASNQWRRQGGEVPPYGWTSKKYVICVCFHCHGTSSYHTTNTLQGRRARATLIHRQYNQDWGTSYSKPPIDPYLTSPLLQNPGGATASNADYRHAVANLPARHVSFTRICDCRIFQQGAHIAYFFPHKLAFSTAILIILIFAVFLFESIFNLWGLCITFDRHKHWQ